MLFQNEHKAPPRPDVVSLRKADEDESQLLYALYVLGEAAMIEPTEPLTLGQQLAAWRARRKANG